MIFHQFTAAELAAIGRNFQSRARLVLACEPERSENSQRAFRVIAPLFGASRSSCHDGDVSIAAGFQSDELPRLLGLDDGQWRWRCHTSVLGANRMVACRRDRPDNPV
jgi:hypothetical protein